MPSNIVVLFLAFYFSLTVALVNVTVDDLATSILYQPPEKWRAVSDPSCSGGGYSIGHDSCVNATIQCNWVSFHYLAPRWPFPISTEISIDGGAPIIVDLQDHSAPIIDSGPSTVGSTVAFSYHGSESKLHTVLITGSTQNPYALVDALIFEIVDGGACHGNYGGNTDVYSYGSTKTETITTTTTTTETLLSTNSIKPSSYPSGSGTAPPSTYSSSPPTRIIVYSNNHGLIIGIGILGAILALLLLLLLLFLIWRRRRHLYGQYGRSGHPRPGSSHGSLNPTYGGGEGGTATYGGGGASTTYGGAGTATTGATGGAQPYMREAS